MWIRLQSRSLVLAAVLFAAACASAPEWERGSVDELRVWPGDLSGSYLPVTDAAEIEALLAGFRSAERVENKSDNRAGWRHIDVVGRGVGGRWLYEPETGRFSRLAHNRKPVFRLKESDRLRLNQLFSEASQSLSNTHLSR